MQAARSSIFPILSTTGSYARSHAGTTSSNAKTTSQYLLNADVSWEIDLWGKIRKTIEANSANAQASAADLENARLSAQAQLAQDYFELASLDAQKKLLDDTDAIYQKFLTLTKNRYASGVAAQSDVLQAQTQIEMIEAQSIDIGVQRSQLEHAIAVLIGKPASDFSIPSLTLAARYPLSRLGFLQKFLSEGLILPLLKGLLQRRMLKLV